MNPTCSKLFRSVQVFFPGIQDLRFKVQRTLRAAIRKTHEDDFQFLRLLRDVEHKLFLDIGANRGEAIQSMLMMCSDARIIAFEPNPLLSQKLSDLYRGNRKIKIVNSGLADQNSTFPLYIPFYRNYMFDGLASFSEHHATDWLKTRLFGYRDEFLRVKKVRCQVKKLDDFNLDPTFMKIDVQGFEYNVIQGGKNTIMRHRPLILMEAPKEREKHFFFNIDYQPHIYRQGKLHPGTNKYNVFFLPEEKANDLVNLTR